MGEVIPYETLVRKRREKKYGTDASRIGGLPRVDLDVFCREDAGEAYPENYVEEE